MELGVRTWGNFSAQLMQVHGGMVIITQKSDGQSTPAVLLQTGDFVYMPRGFMAEWDVRVAIYARWKETDLVVEGSGSIS